MSHSNPLVSVLCQNLRTPGRRAFLLRGTILLAMAAAWLSAAPAARAQCPLSFAAAVNYPAGDNPLSVAIGDLNGDGRPDLAVANSALSGGTPNVSVLLNNGDGTFAAEVNYPAGDKPLSVAIGDLNADGKPDLAVANSAISGGTPSVSVLLGNGDGTFAAEVNYPAGFSPRSVAIGDLNGDGSPDLAVANSALLGGTGSVSVLLNNGDGTFAAAVNYDTYLDATSVAIGDLNADGWPDLAVANSAAILGGVPYVLVLLNNGDGTFFAAGGVVAICQPFSVAIGDLNADGSPDLAVAYPSHQSFPLDPWQCTGNQVSVYFNNGDGTFAGEAAGLAGDNPRSVAIGDLNADGSPDLAVANQNSANVSVLLGNGDGTFAAAVNYPAGSSSLSVAIGDLNGDGRPDLAVAIGGSNVSVLLNTSPGFPAPVFTQQPMGQVVQAGEAAVFSVTAKGLDATLSYQWRRNGAPLVDGGNISGTATNTLTINPALPGDVAWYDVQVVRSSSCTGNEVATSTAVGLGVVTPPPPSCASSFAAAVDYAAGAYPNSVAVGDLNNDGNPDLAVANAGSGDVSVLLNSGNGAFAAAVNYAAGNDPSSVAIGDLNADGSPDLAVANAGSGDVSVLLGSGDGTFAAAVNYATGTEPVSVAIGDLNGDGRPDLVTANFTTNNVSVLPGNGDGTFAAAVNYGAGTNPISVAIGDLNADGWPDLAVANRSSENVSVLLNSSDGAFDPAVNYAAGIGPYSVAIGDLSGDGRPDLAVANSDSDNVSVLLGSGNGAFDPAVNYAAGYGPFSVAIGDLNGDGRPDLAVANNDNVSVRLNNGDGAFDPAVNYGVGSFPISVAIGDLNNDGNPDLAVANFASDNVSVLLNDGPSIGISPQPASQIVIAGDDAVFTATATGTGPFSYQWRRNGLPMIGATSDTLIVQNVSEDDVAAYDVEIRGGCNPTAKVTSHPAVLIVEPACPGDFEPDGDVDMIDFSVFQTCFTGPL